MKRVISLFLSFVMLFTLVSCKSNEVTKIILDEKKLTLEIGDSHRLTYETNPEDADVEVVWESSDEDVATVDEDGFVEAIGSGVCQITVSVSDTITSECRVHVNEIEETDNSIVVPDVSGCDETAASNAISSIGLIPTVEHQYSDEYEEGEVIRCNPAIGSEVDQATRVTIYISDGPSEIYSVDSAMTWQNTTTSNCDDWNFYNPYIEDGILYIECIDVTFDKSFSWLDNYNEGVGVGYASLTDTFDITVPCEIDYSEIDIQRGESTSFTLSVPLSEFQSGRPTTVYFSLFANDTNNNQFRVTCNFSMTW